MMRVDPETLRELERLKIHPSEAVGDVVARLIRTKAPAAEADALESAEARFEAYLESRREAVREAYRQEIRDKLSEGAEKDAEARKLLGIDTEKGETIPAWGVGKKKKD